MYLSHGQLSALWLLPSHLLPHIEQKTQVLPYMCDKASVWTVPKLSVSLGPVRCGLAD